jgi:hypothetical protein
MTNQRSFDQLNFWLTHADANDPDGVKMLIGCKCDRTDDIVVDSTAAKVGDFMIFFLVFLYHLLASKYDF